MIVFITYCSARKDPARGELPAVQRYRSARIAAVLRAAERVGARFRILSGKFGLLEPLEKIPDYDHLLLDAEVERHVAVVADQLALLRPERVVFFSRSRTDDPGVAPYRDAISGACENLSVPLRTVEIDDRSIAADRLEELL